MIAGAPTKAMRPMKVPVTSVNEEGKQRDDDGVEEEKDRRADGDQAQAATQLYPRGGQEKSEQGHESDGQGVELDGEADARFAAHPHRLTVTAARFQQPAVQELADRSTRFQDRRRVPALPGREPPECQQGREQDQELEEKKALAHPYRSAQAIAPTRTQTMKKPCHTYS